MELYWLKKSSTSFYEYIFFFLKCICNLNKVALIGAPVCVTRFHWSKIFEFNYVSWDFISRIYVTVNVIGYLPFFFQIMELI
jgi:hypothetical protein